MAVTSSDFPSAPARVRVGNPGDLIAAIPALLGFYPTRSIVLICLGGQSGKQIGPLIRHDMLPHGISEDDMHRMMAALSERIAAMHEVASIRSVLCLFVDDWPSTLHDVIASSLGLELGDWGIALGGALWTPSVAAGQPWRALGGDPRKGKVSDPAVSPVTTAQVVAGHQIFASRDGLAETLAPASVADTVPVALSVQSFGPVPTPEDEFETILVAAACVDLGDKLEPDVVAKISNSLSNEHKLVRDAALALAATSFANAAEQLWTLLARLLPADRRAEPLAMLGHSAYLRGDGALACVAFTEALKSNPRHVLAGMLDDALQRGIAPDLIREFTNCGFECASTLGFELRPAV